VEKATIRRGDILAGKDALRPTYMVDAFLQLLSSATRKLKNRGKGRFHTGTSEIISTVILLDREELKPGESCYAQIRLDEPTAVLKGDHYVLRSYSPVRTVAGGEILNALPRKKKRFSDAALSEMKVLHTGALNEVIERFVSLARFQGVEQAELPFLTNTSKRKLEGTLRALLAQKRIIQYDKERGTLIHTDFLTQARNEIIETITRYHKDFPLRMGLPKEELRSRTGGVNNPRLFNFMMSQLVQENVIVLEKEMVRLEAHRVTLAEDQEEARRKLEEIYLKAGLQPPYFKEVKDQFSGNTGNEVMEVMVKEGVLVKIKEDLYFHHTVLEDLQERLVDFLKKRQGISTPEFKDMTGASRKYTIPLIEYFDRAQVTVRVGDNRVLRKK
jgi:selenocysteine-specific elongation factor